MFFTSFFVNILSRFDNICQNWSILDNIQYCVPTYRTQLRTYPRYNVVCTYVVSRYKFCIHIYRYVYVCGYVYINIIHMYINIYIYIYVAFVLLSIWYICHWIAYCFLVGTTPPSVMYAIQVNLVIPTRVRRQWSNSYSI